MAMGKGKRIEVEFQLPEPIIQHIQSFLSGKQAAQTTILSKSWYTAWLTRPNLDFDQREFRGKYYDGSNEERFRKFVNKTMQRYEESNLKFDSLKLWIADSISIQDANLYAKELIVKALKMGVTDLNFEHDGFGRYFVLPHEVFQFETLIRLSLTWCEIDGGLDGEVCCSRLNSLSLRCVFIPSDTISDIISSCPLIEELLLSGCYCLSKFASGRAFNYYIEFGKQSNLYEFRKLKRLFLENVSIDALFFCDFSSKFPCLKDLSLHECDGYKGLRISSRALECISFREQRMLRVKFDVPRLHKFTFSGGLIPSLSFKAASRECEANISIKCLHRSLNTSWFLKLNKFLTKLSLTKVSLSLNLRSISEKSSACTRDIQSLPKPVVENLTINVPSSACLAFLDRLFWVCRPKYISQYWLPESSWQANSDFLEILCKRLMQQVSRDSCVSNQSMFGQCDPEEVNVELFDEVVSEWQPLPWETLLDASASPENKQKVRFQLRWGLESVTLR